MNSHQLMNEWMIAGNLTIPSILLKSYTKLGLSNAEFICLLNIYEASEKGERFVSPEKVHTYMDCTQQECAHLFRSLVHKQVIGIEKNRDSNNVFSFSPLWKKLTMLIQEPENKYKEHPSKLEPNIYTIFEQEFGRPLSPIECETLSSWIDQDYHPSDIIKQALREAIISGKVNFRYIDRILFDWKKNGIQTIEAAKQHSQRFRTHQNPPTKTEEKQQKQQKRKTMAFYNWLEE
ncbi:DnaD domain-containing protein (plasmid) [Rossellomorea sp. AcN35-11]|nr:DnaD domain-containing protein [Rossellomorea aquimaris]WJV32406.1 DnaD domain-containing protein [Rossellomorea sp. AcN35-11]